MVRILKYRIEIQIRTGLQHSWAEISEKLSDDDPLVKYGRGAPQSRKLLEEFEKLIRNVETSEKNLSMLENKLKSADIEKIKDQMVAIRRAIQVLLEKKFAFIAKEKR